MGLLPTFVPFTGDRKPHALCIPFPAQGHINPMLMLAKLLHARYGFQITFVNTEYIHARLLKSRGPNALDGLPGFRFETIPDGLPPTDVDVKQHGPSLCDSMVRTCLPHFRGLLARMLGTGVTDDASQLPPIPPVTCVVSDGAMSFTLDAADELGVPEVLFWTTSACGFNALIHIKDLVARGLVPLSEEQLAAIPEYLETTVEGIPGMDGIRLRDFPSFVLTKDSDDIMLKFLLRETERASRAKAIILNTFDELENKFLSAMAPVLPPVYSIGPLCLHLSSAKPDVLDPRVTALGSNLWKNETQCLDWLDGKSPGSVVYVNFGSITVMTNRQLVEFAWGLANSGRDFLWIIRPGLVGGDTAVLPAEFHEETRGRCLMAGWCPQEQVLAHPAVGGFLTHCGWNSTLESICGGVPMLCWPFFADQQTNCRYVCTDWGLGIEIDSDVRREVVEGHIRDLMDSPKGDEMREQARRWKTSARDSILPGGSSLVNLDTLVKRVLRSPESSA